MTPTFEIAPGIRLREQAPPLDLSPIRLVVLAMDSAMLYPGVEEFATACTRAGMTIDTSIGEHQASSEEKLRLLQSLCAAKGIDLQQVLVVGRSADDAILLAAAGASISFMATPEATGAAQISITAGSLDRVLQWVKLPQGAEVAGLDLSVLDTMVGHDPEKFRKFALLFISSIEDVLVQIEQACNARDLQVLGAMGHRAKSTAKSIGAEFFSANCLLLEQAARSGQLSQSLDIANRLRPQFETIRFAITQRLGL